MEKIINIGVDDIKIDLFEGQYPVPDGISYNSYLILDEKIAVLDTVDEHFCEEWLSNLEKNLGGRMPDFLVVHHMEPDHSANIVSFMQKYKSATVVASQMAFEMMSYFFENDFKEQRIVIKEGDELNLGEHTLKFISAPMVHWPEVMMSYEIKTKTLFSADAFGKFGTSKSTENWDDEARRYYIGIVGKYGMFVQKVLKKAATLEIERMCSLHGPILEKDLSHYLGLYDTWSSYKPETKGVAIMYASIYGNTKKAAEVLYEKLKERSVKTEIFDLARCDMFAAVAAAFRYDRIVISASTYNGSVFPFMKTFLDHLVERNFQNRTVGIIEGGSWVPMASRTMKDFLSGCKDVKFIEHHVTLRSAVHQETIEKIDELAELLSQAE